MCTFGSNGGTHLQKQQLVECTKREGAWLMDGAQHCPARAGNTAQGAHHLQCHTKDGCEKDVCVCVFRTL